jgi:hypothetical protein
MLLLQACDNREYVDMSPSQVENLINQQSATQIKEYISNRRFSTIPSTMYVNCFSIRTDFVEKENIIVNSAEGVKRGNAAVTIDHDACIDKVGHGYISAVFIRSNKLVEIRCVYDQGWKVMPPVMLNNIPQCQEAGYENKAPAQGWEQVRVIKRGNPSYLKEWPL